MLLAAVRLTAVSLCSLVLAVGATAPARGQGEVGYSIFPPAPRELRQHVTRAEAAIADERFSDAVAELGQVLSSPQSDDFFLGSPGDSQISLKTQALALLGSMPEKGRRMYELQFGADARAALEEALHAGDLARLTEVCRRYFHTKAGYEATLLMGRIQLDQGRPLAAALTLKRVADVPSAAAQYDPELSVLLATCWLHAGREQQASDTLVALKQRLPNAKVRLVEGPAPLFARDDEALAWLERIVGGPRGVGAVATKEWVVYRGNEARNARSLGGVPLLNFIWRVPTVNDPTDEGRVAQRARLARDGGEPLISSLQPLVVQNYCLVRQPETNKLVGLNLQKQGKRDWVFPTYDDYPPTSTQANPPQQLTRNPNLNVREQELKQRVWDDHLFGQASSDGKQVYVIDKLGYAAIPNVTQGNVLVRPGPLFVPNAGRPTTHNVLVALDLKREGWQAWGVGGERGDDNPALAGAFFLGPPLPLGDQLYALAEFSGEVRLVCLSAKNGALEWKQQIAVLEDGQHILYDSTRRLAGASPSYADGVLICPTSAGAVVAVDLPTRTLRWGYQYPRWDISRMSGRAGFRASAMQVVPTQGRWLDATATIAGGAVILTPPESQELHCLDLLTGTPRWPSQPRDDMLLVACVHDNQIVLVGDKRMKSIHLADGKPGWFLDLEDSTPTGRGYYSDRYYYLPVTGRELLKIDLDEGKVVSRAQTEIELGNLVAYHDQLVSIGPQHVASFVLLSEALQQKLDERLAANPDDVEALSLRGQILLQEGKPDESLALLRRAHALAPDVAPVRELLVKVMLALLRQDLETHLALTDELDKLVTEPAQRREVLRWRIMGLARAERTADAVAALLELADYELQGPSRFISGELDAVDRELSVRADRWIQGQLHHIHRVTDSATRERLAREIQARIEPLLAAGETRRLRSALHLFGFHEASRPARLALAERLIEADALLEAELLVGELLAAGDREVAGAAHAALAALYERARRFDLAVRQYETLASQFADVDCRQGKTGRELRQQAEENAVLRPWFAAIWPVGQVEVQEDAAVNRAMFARQFNPLPISEFYGAAPRGMKAWLDLGQQQLIVRSETGQQQAVASLRSGDVFTRISLPAGAAVGVKAHGHLLIVPLGAEVVAVDALRGERSSGDSVLWRQETGDLDSRGRVSFSVQRPGMNPLVSNTQRYEVVGGQGTGPVAAAGLCILKGRQLVCIDPLTGETLWDRGSIPQQAEIFGDGELIFVADSGGETLVLSAIDGSLIDKVFLDRSERRWTTHGRNVLTWEQQGGTIQLRLYDPLTPALSQREREDDASRGVDPKSELWSRRVPGSTKGTIIDGEELALLEPGGQFTVVSLADGQTQFSVPLEAEPSLSWIQVIRSRGQYLLLACRDITETSPNVRVQAVAQGSAVTQLAFQGRVYAFSRSTGKLQWHTPAYVSQQCLPPDQPTESPLLLFACNRIENRPVGGRTSATPAVLVLDRRDGRIVHDGTLELNQPATQCDIVADPLRQTVSLTLTAGGASRATVFRLTDKPAAPQPPAQTGEMASDRAGQLPGTVDRSVGAAIERLNRGANPATLIPPAR